MRRYFSNEINNSPMKKHRRNHSENTASVRESELREKEKREKVQTVSGLMIVFPLMHDYFDDNVIFQRRSRCKTYGRISFFTKIHNVIRMIAYDTPPNELDESFRMYARTI